MQEPSSNKVLGHVPHKELVPWETQIPRDNSIYQVSETHNLRHLDDEIREKYRENLALVRVVKLKRSRTALSNVLKN